MKCRCLVVQVTMRKRIRRTRAIRWPRRPSLWLYHFTFFCVSRKWNSLFFLLYFMSLILLVCAFDCATHYTLLLLKINIIYLILRSAFSSAHCFVRACNANFSLFKCHSWNLFPTLLELVSLFQSSRMARCDALLSVTIALYYFNLFLDWIFGLCFKLYIFFKSLSGTLLCMYINLDNDLAKIIHSMLINEFSSLRVCL